MKFVYFGYDHMLPCARRLIQDGHMLLGIFTFNCDNVFNFNRDTIALGQSLDVPVTLEKPEAHHVKQFIKASAEVFIGAGFPSKIPVPNEGAAYAINMHPALLPKGRGIMPTPTIIMHEPDAAGLSIHKMTDEFDAGDILIQESLPLSANETVDSYSARIAEIGPEMLSSVMSDLPRYWGAARPQDQAEATIFPAPTSEMRSLDWSSSVETIDKTARAFGSFGCLCRVEEQLLVVYDLGAAEQAHDFDAGYVVERTQQSLTIAVSDGVVSLKKFEIVK